MRQHTMYRLSKNKVKTKVTLHNNENVLKQLPEIASLTAQTTFPELVILNKFTKFAA